MTEQRHKLIATQQPDGQWTGTCTCRKWVGVGGSKREALEPLHAEHVKAVQGDQR